MKKIIYRVEPNLLPQKFKELLIRSTLSERRPIDEPDRIEKMCKNANLIITARVDGKLIGVSRALTDYAFCIYLSDLAADYDYQRRGIGKQLVIETKKQSPQATLILLAAPEAIDYYSKIGMSQYEFSYILKNIEDIK